MDLYIKKKKEKVTSQSLHKLYTFIQNYKLKLVILMLIKKKSIGILCIKYIRFL